MRKKPVHYLQYDPKWGKIMFSNHNDTKQTIASSGCGAASSAMVLATLRDPAIAPEGVAYDIMDSGYRTYNNGVDWAWFPVMAKKYGLRMKQTTSTDETIEELKNNALVVASMGPGYFTKFGHYILLWNVDEANKIIYVNDPNSTTRTKAAYDIFKKQARQYFIFYGEAKGMEPKQFISLLVPDAQKLQLEFGIFASVTLAQAALETGWGKFMPKDKNTGQVSYNLFGVKGKGTAGSVLSRTWEVYDGKRVEIDAQFRAYNNYLESLRDHHAFLMQDRYIPVCQAVTPGEAAEQLYKCGYATDPDYPKKLIDIINTHNLQQYDIVVAEWARESWRKAMAKGILDGTNPQGAVTREMLAVMLNRCGLLDAAEIPQSFVDALKAAGIISSDHPVGARPTWGELASVISKLEVKK